MVRKLEPELRASFMARGTHSFFVFSYLSFNMLKIDPNIVEFTGISAKEFQKRPFNELVGKIIAPEHVYTTTRFGDLSFSAMYAHPGEDLNLSIEYDILPGRDRRTRLLVQFKPVCFNTNGLPVLCAGFMSDITHLAFGRPALMTITLNGKLQTFFQSTREEILAGLGYPLTNSELAVLDLKKKGLRAKEIASGLRMKEMTVNSLFRDIKKKTATEILPLIQLLGEKGVL
jgi:DNA-binding CsgD family transcriptional regulator